MYLFRDGQHTGRKSGDGEDNIGSFCLGICFLQGNGILVLHTIGNGQRTRGVVLEESLLHAIQKQLSRRAGEMKIGALLFSNEAGLLGLTETARELLEEWRDGT